ncbi:RNA-binding S4 domain-containing protein [Deinococcus radiopugnans]|uniref:RNA-binding S4 domain-containing protein n=1 Tax=Deinococcus radiopugnans TaxID=57497 RepID=UPI0006897E67|nr:RNA-binding S4 domain-containing protein [Deinococcus radiopugnans]
MTGSRDTVRDGGQDGGQDTIDLQDFLKISGVVDTGGEAKFRVQGGEVRLNGEIETRRRKKLRRGDVVEYAGETLTVDW